MTEKKQVQVNVDPARMDYEDDAYTPLVDILQEQDGTTVLVAEVPGATQDSVDIRVEKGVLTISADGRREPLGEDYSPTYTGFVTGQYFRAFALSDEVDREKIHASLTDGVLRVRLPRAEAVKTRKIPIREE
jgi:HSP20 family molecular chaperone IbpA